jgi:glutamine cyclotransferase
MYTLFGNLSFLQKSISFSGYLFTTKISLDNLVKRQSVDDLTCALCNELETCNQLFFDCVVAKTAWSKIKLCAGSVVTVVDINSLAKFWDTKRDNSALNMIHAGLLWVLWLTRNDMYFKRNNWPGMQVI